MYYHDTVALNVKCIILYLYKKIKKFKTHRYSQSTKKKKIVKFNTFGLEETIFPYKTLLFSKIWMGTELLIHLHIQYT